MTYLDNLLKSTGSLEVDEVEALRNWAEILKSDMRIFGPTVEDAQRLRAIQARIRLASTPKPISLASETLK